MHVAGPEGLEITIQVKQSKDCVPALVAQMEQMRCDGAAIARERQEQWAATQQKKMAAKAAQAAKATDEPTKSARKRAKRKAALKKKEEGMQLQLKKARHGAFEAAKAADGAY